MTHAGSESIGEPQSKDPAADYFKPADHFETPSSNDTDIAARPMGVETPAGAAGRLLLVDDDQRYLDSLKAVLLSHNFDVNATLSSADALERLQHGDFDAVVLDLNMPQVSGIDILRRLEADPRNIKSVVVSGESSPMKLGNLLRHGADDYLVKPCQPVQLVTAITNLIARKRLEDENRRMQERIEQSDQLHRYLVNQSPDAIYMLDQYGRFTFINSKVDLVFGRDRESLLNQHWSRLMSSAEAERANYRFNERRTGSRATRSFEVVIEADAGTTNGSTQSQRYLEVTAQGIWRPGTGNEAIFEGTYGVARDITQRRQTAIALEESRKRFYELFQSSPDAVFIARLDNGTIIESNESFRAIAEQSGKPERFTNDALLWPNTRRRRAFVNRLREGKSPASVELAVEVAEGVRHFEIAARLIQAEGDECMLATLRDVTQQKGAEDERLALQNQLQEARKLEAIGQLAGGIAHDFNNILASMIGYAELALMPGPLGNDTQRRGYLEQVVTAGQRARDLIAQLLSFSRTNRAKAEPMDMAQETRQALRMLRSVIPTTIDIDDSAIAAELPTVVMDPVHLQQILINLFINARDAITGIGRISLSLQPVRHAGTCASCGTSFEGEWVALEVRDSGMGISAGLLPRIFDRFVTGRDGGKGTGIGLSVIHSIVHDYDGHVLVQSEPNQGTVFTVYFSPGGAPQRTEAPRPVAVPLRTESGRVLVIDDEASVGNYVAEALRSTGFEAVVYSDPISALDYVETQGQTLSLVITDQTMPRLTGVELAARIRFRFADLPVVLITGHQDPIRARTSGTKVVDRVLVKPFSVEELLQTAATLVRNREITQRPAIEAPEKESTMQLDSP